MMIDQFLRALRGLPRPQLSPFFARRISAIARPKPARRAPLALKLYWFAIVFAASPLLSTRIGIAAVALVGAVMATLVTDRGPMRR